jgi:hypothetical protein
MRISPTRFVRSLVAGALACALCACGGGSKSAPSGGTTPTPAAAPAAAEPDPKESATPTSTSPTMALGGVQTGGDDGDMATFFLDLDNEQNIIPVLKLGAQHAGCEILGEQETPPAVAAKCPGGAVAILQEGKKLGVGCPQIDQEACRQVFGNILQSAMKLLEEQKGGA